MPKQNLTNTLFQLFKAHYIVVAALFFLTTGCTNNKNHLYHGETRSESEIAKISPWRSTNQTQHLNILAISIDGKNTSTYNPKKSFTDIPTFSVLPGKHTIKIALYTSTASTGKNKKPKVHISTTLTFNAKAGHHYITKAFVPDVTDENALVSFWLEDTKTEDVIAGTRNQSSTLIRHKSKAVPL